MLHIEPLVIITIIGLAFGCISTALYCFACFHKDDDDSDPQVINGKWTVKNDTFDDLSDSERLLLDRHVKKQS